MFPVLLAEEDCSIKKGAAIDNARSPKVASGVLLAKE